MEINLSKESLRKWGTAALVIFALLGGGYWLVANGVLARFIPAAQPAEEAVLSPGGEVAARGVEVFYTLDYEADTAQDWLDRVCAVSTPQGCKITETFMLRGIEVLLDQAQPATTCAASPVRMVASDTDADGNELEVWEVSYSLSNPWDGAEGEQSVFAQVSKTNDEWVFVRILFDQEAEKYSEEAAR